MLRNIAMTIEYCGTAYCGWQIQDSDPTVQAEVERALSELCGEKISVTGCSRTDSGVHARNFVLNFKTASTIPPDRFPQAVNSFLPGDIAAKSAAEVPDGFHARFDAKFKTYRYYFYIAPFPDDAVEARVARKTACDRHSRRRKAKRHVAVNEFRGILFYRHA